MVLTAALALPAALPAAQAESLWPLPGQQETEELIEDAGAESPLEEVEGLEVGIIGSTQPGGSAVSVGGAPMTFFHYPAPSAFGFANGAGETSIGSNLDTGKTLFLLALETARVTWDDTQAPPRASWEDVTFPTTGVTSLDPYLWTDQSTGRTWVLQLAGAESLGAYTDDDGDTWVPMGNPGVPPSFDHQKLTAGPYHAPAPSTKPAPYPNALYYCAQQGVTNGDRNGLAQCARSDDGGITFGAPFHMDVFDCFPIHDQAAVGPDGAVYVPMRGCGPLSSGKPLGAMKSVDNGITWDPVTIPGTFMSTYNGGSGFEFGSPADIAFDKAGKLYYVGASGVFVGGVQTEKIPFVATTTDGGATWSAPYNIGASVGVRNAEMASIVAGDAGRAAAMFYGATTGGNDQTSGFQGAWHLYVSYTFDGGVTWTTVDTTPNDPVQVGCIWNRGGSNACRNLLDFQDITIDREGRVLVGYADGCISSSCINAPSPGKSRDSYGKIARQTTGKRMFAAFDPPGGVDPLKVDAGGPYKTQVGTPVTLSGLAYGGVPAYSLAWDFDGDGTTDATGATPSYPATSFGRHTVRLTATDAGGRVAVDTAEVLVRQPAGETVVASFGFDGDGACDAQGWTTSVGAEVRLIGVSAGGTQWHTTTSQPASAPCAFYHGDDTLNQYTDSSASNLVSPGGDGCFFLPPNAQGARLAFNLGGASEAGFDFLRVQARQGCDAGVFSDLVPAISGTVSALPAYAAQSRTLDDLVNIGGGGAMQVRFRFTADEIINAVGFRVDDVRLLVRDGAPVLDPVGDKVTDDVSTLGFTLAATDPDLDPVTFSAVGLPEGATLDAATGAFAWSPRPDQAPGLHEVTFVASDGLFEDRETVLITVRNVPPTPVGTLDPSETDRLTPVHFDGSASSDVDGTVVAYLWDLGDGATSTEQSPTHTYTRLGTFHVTLTVTDDDGDSATADVGAVKVKNLKPKAKASGATEEANRVDPVGFGSQSEDPDGRVASHLWDFGDGTTSTDANPTHRYAALGTYTATLTVTDDDGDTDTATLRVRVVNLAPRPDFATDPERPMALLPTEFEDLSADRDGSVASWSWELGDGATSTEQDPSHVYVKGGPYTVLLTIADNDGAVATLERVVWVCAPGVQAQHLLEPGHLHVEVTTCIDV